MGKAHRDNHAARVKRGPGAFAKKAERRQAKPCCNVCGTPTKKLEGGLCMVCRGLRPVGPPRPRAF